MTISFTVLCKITSLVCSFLRENEFQKFARSEVECAISIGTNANNEANQREPLNRMLVHLESALNILQKKTPAKNSFIGNEKKVWNRTSETNSIVVMMALIHFFLGNKEQSKNLLLTKMSNNGSCSICYFDWGEFPKELNLNSTKDLYKLILEDKYEIFDQTIIKTSEETYESLYGYDDSDYEIVRQHLLI